MLHLSWMLRPLVSLYLTCFLLAAPQQEPQKQPTSAPTEDAPASIGLLLDHSGSMSGKLSFAIAALQELVKASNTSSKKMLKVLHQPSMPAVYAIGLFQYEELGARKALDMLTQETGGRTFYAENEKQLNDMALQVAHEIRALKITLLQDNDSDSAVKH